jgi:vault protein inter-alpha-trypsin-like protein
MTSTAPQTRIDPLHAFMAGAFAATTPMPLAATRFDVVIDGGLAIVTTTRTFRNAEPHSIEATITFPVPVHATLFALEARIGERVLRARAQRKDAARAHYEAAIDRGKTAVLHEEVLRGVHMLSVGHVPPATEVVVEFRWAMTMTHIERCGHLRIPLTVGDIYGRSGLPDSDALIHAGLDQAASLAVQCRDGTVTLRGGRLEAGQARVGLDAPIDLEVAGWMPKDLRGRSADGREVAVRIEPAGSGETALDVALLIDRSGSMASLCAFGLDLTKHAAVVLALDAMAKRLQAADVLDLWEFNDRFDHVGSTDEQAVDATALLRRLGAPDGGTEIGMALGGVIAGSSAPDILVLTDGKSHSLDVQWLVRSGRRFAVVLIGEDSLEANIGHLAALSGGEIFIAAGYDIAPALAAALRSLRVRHRAPIESAAAAPHWIGFRAGMRLTASYGPAAADRAETIETRAVAAVAASLVLPMLASAEAAALAEAEGLVSHLTSLVLVDEVGAAQDGIPASRKVPLATPRTQMFNNLMAAAPAPACAMPQLSPDEAAFDRRFAEEERSRCTGRALASSSRRVGRAPTRKGIARRLGELLGGGTLERSGDDLSRIARDTNWDFAPDRLQAGDIQGLSQAVQEAIRTAAAKRDVVALAGKLGLDPIVLVIALMAHAVASQNRSARRIARALLPDAVTEEHKAVARHLGLG